MKQKLTVDEGAATERLDVFLAAKLGLTRSRVQKLIQSGLVLVNGQPEKSSYPVEAGDTVAVSPPEEPPVTKHSLDLPVVYEDQDILVVNKPAGLSAHPGSGTGGEPTLADFARDHTSDPDPERPGIIHRLDRDTSGLMVVAKNLPAKAYMQKQFSSRTVHKTYTLLTVGRPDPPEAVIRLPLDRDPARPLRRAVVPGGREAITRYRTLATYRGYSLIEASPQTGRTHQIRVHFAAVGHPVAGDIIYGQPHRPFGLTRQFLHASALSFTAPSGKEVSLTSPLPSDLEEVLRRLEHQV